MNGTPKTALHSSEKPTPRSQTAASSHQEISTSPIASTNPISRRKPAFGPLFQMRFFPPKSANSRRPPGKIPQIQPASPTDHAQSLHPGRNFRGNHERVEEMPPRPPASSVKTSPTFGSARSPFPRLCKSTDPSALNYAFAHKRGSRTQNSTNQFRRSPSRNHVEANIEFTAVTVSISRDRIMSGKSERRMGRP